jgi:hypothetical protein
VLDLAVKNESRCEQARTVGFTGWVRLSNHKGQVLYAPTRSVQCSG